MLTLLLGGLVVVAVLWSLTAGIKSWSGMVGGLASKLEKANEVTPERQAKINALHAKVAARKARGE